MSTKALMTVEEFVQFSDAASETDDYELVEGELLPLSSASYRHNRIRDLVVHLLWIYFTANGGGEAVGEFDCQIAPDSVRRPDVSVFLGVRLQQIDRNRTPAPLAPDIAIEVISPSESAMDLRRKVRDYLRAGTQEVWLLDHLNAEVLVHTNTAIRVLQGLDALESTLLPGFSAAVADLVVNL